MTVKDYLDQVRLLELKHRYRLQELERLRDEVSPIRGVTYDSARVMTSTKKSTKTEELIDRIVDMERELLVEAAEISEKRRHIIAQIERVPDRRYRELLLLKYVDGYGLRTIACKMGYSYDRAKHMHGQALIEFAKVSTE